MVRRLLVLFAGVVAVLAIAGPAVASGTQPVRSLTPAATQRLWTELVRRPQVHALRTADCRPLRAVFYAATDWLRLTTKLAATASPCAQYYVSVPPLVADKSQLRPNEANRIRALGPAFHALAEINVTGWTAWVASTGSSWYQAGVEARRRMATTGYDVAAGDTWALNELSSAVRQGTGNARANMRAFLNGLYDGDGVVPTARGTVFVAGIGQGTADLSLYQARLQDWYEDAAFWSDLSRFASDWSQEVYGDVRNYAVAGAARETRRDWLNEYLQHQTALAGAAPPSADVARSFLAAFSSPLANAAWRYDAAFGWTDVPVELMADYASAQTYAMRSAGTGRFGYAWAPKNLAAIPAADFNAQTDALLVRLAAAIADSGDTPEAACGASWCTGSLGGAAATPAWSTFGAWKSSRLAFTSPEQTVAPGAVSSPLTVELQTSTGTAYTAGVPVDVALSSSPTGELSTSPDGPWAKTLTAPIASGATAASFYFRDADAGSATITAAAAGKTAATQTIAVGTPPPASPAPSGGGGGPAPDLVVQASATPAAPAVGGAITYTVTVRNLGGPAARALLAVQLPTQVAYVSSQSDRGPGCTGTTALSCDLDFLAGDLVATVRIGALVRQPGILAFAAVSSAQPADPQPANDTAVVSTVVEPRAAAGSATIIRPTLRAVGTPTRPARARGVATVSVRFSLGGSARLEARLTTSTSTQPITLLAGSSLAGVRSTKARPHGRRPGLARRDVRLQGPGRRRQAESRPYVPRQADGRRRGRPAADADDPGQSLMRDETLFVVDRPAGVEWVAGKGAREQPLWDEHAAFMDALFERGVIALGGPFLDDSGAMLVMRVTDASEARALLEPDPWCSNARDIQGIGRIRPWTIFLDSRGGL